LGVPAGGDIAWQKPNIPQLLVYYEHANPVKRFDIMPKEIKFGGV
jgi:hypothetical protein